ncbi:MAG: PHP domain-containing protein [Gemmatimonadetes bacterium]|nr:PHP domain-containing protein [Gemmatimonadota bacterium]
MSGVAGTVDLHAHSTASDGSAAPGAAVELAHQAGVAAFALTDHDTMAGIPAAQEMAQRLGLRFIPGVELSVHQDATEVHLLGLHIADVSGMEQALTTFRDGRRERARTMVERLVAVGAPIDFEAVLAAAAGGAIGRPHVAKALVNAGHVRDHREAFDKYLAAGRPAYVDKARLEIAEGIALIHRHGGLAVIAHPGPDGRRERVEPLIAMGLDGLEVRHPSHSGEDVKRILALVEHFGMVPSGGSDWHGAMMGPRTLGAMQVPMAWLERQDARLASRRAAA